MLLIFDISAVKSRFLLDCLLLFIESVSIGQLQYLPAKWITLGNSWWKIISYSILPLLFTCFKIMKRTVLPIENQAPWILFLEEKLFHEQRKSATGDNLKCVKWIHFLMGRNKRERSSTVYRDITERLEFLFLLFMLVGTVRFSEKRVLLLTKIR